jgi:hypothetical protein
MRFVAPVLHPEAVDAAKLNGPPAVRTDGDAAEARAVLQVVAVAVFGTTIRA